MSPSLLLVALLTPVLALIPITPDPIAFQLGPIPVYWYGVCYAVGLAVTYVVITREARRRGLNARLVDNGIIVVGVVALIGGRMYHVIDQWQLYKDNLVGIILPPYSGLGVYGGILTGAIAVWVLMRLWHQSFGRWVDVIAPGLFVMQAIGRWGNFFNQELYGPPTDLPWGIAIDCVHRVVPYLCAVPPTPQDLTTGFHPLFLYESLSGVLGAITLLWIARRYGRQMRPGDLLLIFLVWYAAVRFGLETLRTGNWTILGIPTAMLVSGAVIIGALVLLAFRHRPGAGGERWGDPPEPGSDRADAAADDDADDDDEWIEDDEEADGHDEPGGPDGEPEPGEADGEPGEPEGGRPDAGEPDRPDEPGEPGSG